MTTLDNKPEVRCGIVRNGLRNAEKLDPTKKKKILERYPQSLLKTALNTKETDWLPLEYTTKLFECIKSEMSDEEYFSFCIQCNKSLVESSIVGPFVLSALHLFKISPKTLIKAAPLIWNACYRHCGKISIAEEGKSHAKLHLIELPHELTGNRTYFLAITAFIKALDFFTGIEMKVELIQQSKQNRSAVIDASWAVTT